MICCGAGSGIGLECGPDLLAKERFLARELRSWLQAMYKSCQPGASATQELQSPIA
jgi:hypothetical protein